MEGYTIYIAACSTDPSTPFMHSVETTLCPREGPSREPNRNDMVLKPKIGISLSYPTMLTYNPSPYF